MTDINQELVEKAGFKLGRLEAALQEVLKRSRELDELSSSKDPVEISRFLASTIKGLRVTCNQTRDKEYIRSIIHTALSVIED